MPDKYSHITNEMFTEELERLVSQMTTGELMSLPGFYEIVSEHFNNDILANLSDNPEPETEVRVFNIEWDLDDLPEDEDRPDLPEEIVLSIDSETLENDIRVDEYIGDEISDITGFCHKGFEFEEINQEQ